LIEKSNFDPVKLANTPESGRESSQGDGVDVNPETIIPRNARTVVYAGTLEAYQGIDELIEAFAQVYPSCSDVYLVIIGGNAQQVSRYASDAEQRGISDRCVFTGTVPPALARRYNRLATVLVSPRLTGQNTPLKVYEQLASGVPLVATNIYAHTQRLLSERAEWRMRGGYTWKSTRASLT
jgi:glycosyltransferase involved in cell wall biosynthesis